MLRNPSISIRATLHEKMTEHSNGRCTSQRLFQSGVSSTKSSAASCKDSSLRAFNGSSWHGAIASTRVKGQNFRAQWKFNGSHPTPHLAIDAMKHRLTADEDISSAKDIPVKTSDRGRFGALVRPTVTPLRETPGGELGGSDETLFSGEEDSTDESQHIMDLEDADIGQLNECRNPERGPTCKSTKFQMPVIAEKRQYSQDERTMMQAQTAKLENWRVICPSSSEWATQRVCVRRND